MTEPPVQTAFIKRPHDAFVLPQILSQGTQPSYGLFWKRFLPSAWTQRQKWVAFSHSRVHTIDKGGEQIPWQIVPGGFHFSTFQSKPARTDAEIRLSACAHKRTLFLGRCSHSMLQLFYFVTGLLMWSLLSPLFINSCSLVQRRKRWTFSLFLLNWKISD